MGAKLFHDIVQMHLHRTNGEAKLIGDLFVLLAATQQRDDLLFAVGEVHTRCLGLPAQWLGYLEQAFSRNIAAAEKHKTDNL
jgi:hypothetical protein